MTYDDLVEAGPGQRGPAFERSTLAEQGINPVTGEQLPQGISQEDVERILASDDEPTIEVKAAIIAAPERHNYPVHWNDEVAEAFLALQTQQSVDLEQLQVRFEQRLADITNERDGKQLLQVAVPILVKMVENTGRKEYMDRVQQRADFASSEGRPTDPATVLVNGALDLARGLMVGCGFKVRG